MQSPEPPAAPLPCLFCSYGHQGHGQVLGDAQADSVGRGDHKEVDWGDVWNLFYEDGSAVAAFLLWCSLLVLNSCCPLPPLFLGEYPVARDQGLLLCFF